MPYTYDGSEEDGVTTDQTDTEAPAFTVHDEASAAWAADRVLSARERVARIKAACQAMIAEAEREATEAAAFFLPMLEAWARANPPRRGKAIHLTTGSLAFRTVPGGPRVVDEAAALEWARAEYTDAVRVVESLDRNAIKAYVAEAGELPPGVEVVEAREAFDVKCGPVGRAWQE